MPTFTYLFPGRQFYFLFQGRQFLFIHFRDANFYSFFSGTPILIYLFPGRQLLFIYFRDANLGQKIPAASLQLVPSTVVWRVPPTPSPPPNLMPGLPVSPGGGGRGVPGPAGAVGGERLWAGPGGVAGRGLRDAGSGAAAGRVPDGRGPGPILSQCFTDRMPNAEGEFQFIF